MKDPSPTRRLAPPTLEQFKQFVRKVISVSKSEIEKQEKVYKQERKLQKQKT